MKYSRIILGVAALALALCADAAPNRKIFKKAAEKVWNTRSDLFDAHKEIPDSISAGNSAVIIAEFNNIDAHHEYHENNYNVTNRTKREIWVRRMVKLLDANAVKDFSEHEFGNRDKIVAGYRTIASSDNAFGARIHKPDGTIVDVDLKDAYDITSGKNDEVESYKIAIPGLEPGDVLEYFDYTQEWINDLDLADIQIMPYAEYPTMDYVVEGTFHPKLTVEYRTYNGHPLPTTTVNPTDKNKLELHLKNIGTVTDRKLLRKNRQLPSMRLSTLNNTSMLRYYPSTIRKGGLRGNIMPGTIYRDIKAALAASTYDDVFPRQIKKLAENYIKAHPDATPDQKIEAVWLACEYVNFTDEKRGHNDYWLALICADIINKMKLSEGDAGVGFVNSRKDVPTTMIMRWNQPDFGTYANGKIYTYNGFNYYMPGEIPGDYQGEEGGMFSGNRNDLTMATMPTIIKVGTTKSNANRASVKGKVSFDDTEATAHADLDINLTGTTKSLASSLTNLNEWAAAVEDFFDIPANKRYKDKEADPVERKKELEKEAVDFADNFVAGSSTINSIDVVERGIVPGTPATKVKLDLTANEFTSNAGNGILLNIGRFAGKYARLEGADRERMLDAFLTSPVQYYYDIVFEVPQGYAPDAASLENCNVNVSNMYGSFFAAARLTDDGNIELNVRQRFNTYMIPQNEWASFLELSDAAAAFNDAAVLLNRK